ncbi:MAG TPA: DUF167 family protein [Pseudomonadales bacterium]|nr:DUF167 family protein [Pseudomonadales bacterium]
MPFHKIQDGHLVLQCLVQPKASRDEISGVQDERLKIRITAPPVDGKANAHLLRYLSEVLRVPRSRIELLNGETGKRKTVKIIDMAELPALLQTLTGHTP